MAKGFVTHRKNKYMDLYKFKNQNSGYFRFYTPIPRLYFLGLFVFLQVLCRSNNIFAKSRTVPLTIHSTPHSLLYIPGFTTLFKIISTLNLALFDPKPTCTQGNNPTAETQLWNLGDLEPGGFAKWHTAKWVDKWCSPNSIKLFW